MQNNNPRYFDLKSEYGFKKLISLQEGLERFKSFANAIFEGKQQFDNIEYHDNVKGTPFRHQNMKKFDVLSKVKPNTFISAEMARYPQSNFIDRSLERAGALVSHCDFWKKEKRLNFIHINILNFTIRKEIENYISLFELTGNSPSSKKHSFQEVNIELPKFKKNLDQLETDLDKWIYLFKNFGSMTHRPKMYDSEMFKELFADAKRKV